MKKAGLLLLILAAVCFQGLAQTAKIKSCSIAPDNDDDMLTVKVSFDISGCQGEEGRVNVYFYNNATGKALKCYDHTYNTTDNCVATWATITPKYQSTSYTDLEIKIPASELHLADGAYNLYYNVAIKCGGKWLVVNDDKYVFDLTLWQGKATKLTVHNADRSKLVYTYGKCVVCLAWNGRCNVCMGAGRIYNTNNPCPICGGTGLCHFCHGRGGLFTSSTISAPTKRSNSGGNSGGYSRGYTGGYSGGYVGGGTSSGSTTSKTRRTCPGCNGTGKGADEIVWTPNYTGTESLQYCSQCGRTTSPHSHRRAMCRVCYGKGYVN